METAKSSSGWVGAAALGLGLLMACLENEPDSDGEALSGSIRNACGRADGPAIRLRLGPEADTACPGPGIETQGVWWMYLEPFQVETLQPGTRLADSLWDCSPPACEGLGTFEIHVRENRPEAVIGTYEVKLGKGDTAKVRSGPAYLKKCPMTDGLCG